MYTTKKVLSQLERIFKTRIQRNVTNNATHSTVYKSDNEKSIIVRHTDSITTIGINRPLKKNSLNTSTAQYLSEALYEFDTDEMSKVAVIYGIGGTFCAGLDLHEIANNNTESEKRFPHFESLSKRCSIPFKKPLIASITGHAVGAGFELALMCDLRIIEENAVMGIFNRRFGIPMMLGGTVRLPAMIGYARAMDLILKGRGIDAKEALTWGLVTEVVPCGAALGQSIMVARVLTKYPQRSLLADRACAYQATYSTEEMKSAVHFEKENALYMYKESIEGAKYFAAGFGRHGKFPNINPKPVQVRELDESLL